ncbi:MAG: nuclear transport factor 2 family protein [Actinobacteria bacterium]|nr:nuclear transport factor 2 family protein [Actinomycetota bacterium]
MSEHLAAGEIYRRYNEAENRKDSEGTGRYVAHDLYVEINGVAEVASAEADAIAMNELYSCYPDYRREILEMIEAGDRVTVMWSMRGTPALAVSSELGELDVRGVSVVTANGKVMTRASLFMESGALDAVLKRAQQG